MGIFDLEMYYVGARVNVCGHDVLVAGRSTRHLTPPRTPYCWIPSPLDLKYNVFRQTQHIRHIVRGK
jgi:hypothetical protein